MPHAPILGALRALEAIAKLFMVPRAALVRELAEICWKRRRVRCRRLHVYNTDPKRAQGDLGATNRTGFHRRARPGGVVNIAT